MSVATMLRVVCLMACLTFAAPTMAADAAQPKTYESRGQQRSYYEFAPDSIDAGAVAPILIVLHGSGGRGDGMVALWREVGQREGFVVVGPNSKDSNAWHIKEDSPEDFRDLVLAVSCDHFLDARRILLFGQSGGAVYALTLSLLESEFFAAAAIHAGGWREPKEF